MRTCFPFADNVDTNLRDADSCETRGDFLQAYSSVQKKNESCFLVTWICHSRPLLLCATSVSIKPQSCSGIAQYLYNTAVSLFLLVDLLVWCITFIIMYVMVQSTVGLAVAAWYSLATLPCSRVFPLFISHLEITDSTLLLLKPQCRNYWPPKLICRWIFQVWHQLIPCTW